MTITTRRTIDPAALIDPDLFDRLSRRVADDEDVGIDRARRIVRETLVFLVACAAHPEARLSPSSVVDTGWHAFILHTRDYAVFCRRLAGRFIHHQPSDGPDGGSPHDTVRLMTASGLDVDPELWNVEAKCRKDCEQGPKCHQCHAGCHDSP